MDGCLDAVALRMAASALVSSEANPPAPGGEAALLDRLLQGRGRVVGRLLGFCLVESPTADDARTCRTALGLIAGMMEYPYMVPVGYARTRTAVFFPRSSPWPGWMMALAGLAGVVGVGRLVAPTSLTWPVAISLIVVGLMALGWKVRQHLVKRINAVLAEGRAMLAEGSCQIRQARQETAQNSEAWSLLQEAERAFRHTASLGEIYPLLAHYVRRLIPAYDGISVWALNEAEEIQEIQFAAGRHAEQLVQVRRLPRGAGAAGYALETRLPYVIPDLKVDPTIAHPPGIASSGSGLAMPLFTTEGPIGSFVITRWQPGAFADYEVWGAELLAGVAALRIHALRVREREQRLVEEFTRLHRLVNPPRAEAGPCSATVDPMEQITLSLAAASHADGTIVYRITPGQNLVACSSQGLRPEAAARLGGLSASESPASLAIELGVMTDLTRRDLARWPEFQRFFAEAEAERCVVLPIPRAEGTPQAAVVLTYRAGREAMLTPERLALTDTYARYAGATVHNLELYATVMRQSAELRELLGRVVHAQEQERSRIALDLHDWLVQGLAAPSFAIQAADRLLDRSPAGARAELQVALQQLNLASDEMRRIMKGLRPQLLDELGLVEAVKAYAMKFGRSHGIDCRVAHHGADGPGKGSQEALVGFRIIQEALNNVAKHAGAESVEVTLRSRDGLLEISVEDDGSGFDTRQGPASGSYGLLGMQERAALVGGRVRISSLPRCGTRVYIQIPLSRSG